MVEDFDWVIRRVGSYIISNLKRKNLINIEMDRRYVFRNKIIHFGSINTIRTPTGYVRFNESNKHILTIFHVADENKLLPLVPYLKKKINIIHTASEITKNVLIELGFDDKKIIIIPLGVDLLKFKNYSNEKKLLLKKKYNLPQEKIIIGLFQKDGRGWGEGFEPKLVKGPDIFCEIVKKLNTDMNIHVFLTGPARGYVKKKLKEYNVPFTHVILDNYYEIIDCYNAIDLYIIPSRIEGGPLAVLEGMATGVPIISTRVGMVPKVIENGVNGFLTDVGDIEKLYQYAKQIIENSELRNKIIEKGLETAKKYDWVYIARAYYYKLYKNLLNNV